MLTLRRCVVGVVTVLLVGGLASAQTPTSSPCPSGQDLIEERYDDTTSIKSRGCVGPDSERNYRRQGHWEYFHLNGQKHAEGSYVDAHPGGETDSRGILIDGREGLWMFWYANGQKQAERTYKDGKFIADKRWDRNGKPLGQDQGAKAPPAVAKAPKVVVDLDDPETRKKIVANAVRGKKLQFRGKTGEELAYAPNQQKPYTGWKKWIHDNGRLVGLSQFKNGKLDGLRTWWYPNGRKKAERTYEDGKLWTAVRWKPNGEKCPVTNVVNGSGVVVQLHPKGPVHLSTTFKDGKIVSD